MTRAAITSTLSKSAGAGSLVAVSVRDLVILRNTNARGLGRTQTNETEIETRASVGYGRLPVTHACPCRAAPAWARHPIPFGVNGFQ